MQRELLALKKNNTWVLIDLPKSKKAIECKWIYKIKYKPTSEVERLKTHLVIKGYNQIEGLDYKHRFSLIAKVITIRILIVLATIRKWPIFQLEINNAFLDGYWNVEVYMLPP